MSQSFFSSLDQLSAGLHSKSDLHIVRKFWHIVVGLTGIVFYYRNPQIPMVFWTTLALVIGFGFIALETIRLRNPNLNRHVLRVMGPFLRKGEIHHYSSLPFFALGFGFTMLFYSERIAILAMLFLVFADPISSFFGILYGKDKIFGQKSLQGTIAGFVTCYLVTLAYGIHHVGASMGLLGFALCAGVVGSLSELFFGKIIDDNFSMPIMSGLGLTILNLFFNIF